jgi:hypothetical protein
MVMTYEAPTLQASAQSSLVDRLQIEKQVLLNKIQQEGFELGVRSTSNLSYQEFEHFERVKPLAACLDEDVLEYLWTFLDNHGYPEAARTHDPDFVQLLDVNPQSRILFTQGWMDGVISVWQIIKNQVTCSC